MPSHVKFFWWLTVVAVSYAILSLVWYYAFPPAHVLATWAKIPARFHNSLRAFNIEYFVSVVIGNGVWLTLAWFAAYRRKNWARWTIAVWFLLGVVAPLIVYAWYVLMGNDMLAHYYWQAEMEAEAKEWMNPRSYVVPTLACAALIFAFTGNARDWFKAHAIAK